MYFSVYFVLIVPNHILSLSDLCLGVKHKNFKRNTAFSQYDLFDHALAQDPPPQGSILVDTSLVITQHS